MYIPPKEDVKEWKAGESELPSLGPDDMKDTFDEPPDPADRYGDAFWLPDLNVVVGFYLYYWISYDTNSSPNIEKGCSAWGVPPCQGPVPADELSWSMLPNYEKIPYMPPPLENWRMVQAPAPNTIDWSILQALGWVWPEGSSPYIDRFSSKQQDGYNYQQLWKLAFCQSPVEWQKKRAPAPIPLIPLGILSAMLLLSSGGAAVTAAAMMQRKRRRKKQTR